MRNLFSWPGTQHHKKLLGLFVTCGPTRIWTVPHFRSSARPYPMAFPRQGTASSRLPPADGPFLHTILQYSSLNAHPFVIQPFNFFQMFPNKQRNKIKREPFFFTTKPNGPKLSQPVKQCQSWLWEGEAGGEKREAGTLVSYLQKYSVCVFVCVFQLHMHAVSVH